ncbi:hypothetical protein N7462_003068 [Penicillium macrosclerotiorum]|uniref:uncharacterized protein n=1 Tax=Penicillium macrosclerotiorum TaxID=303699 RepID=UPI002548D885|nr:uncharacterized protein N7462_003068 [Penicillium macrosclerotiorum]KAJ5688676.1 hypothetical protein N7462_003068 [Penicillium macrosclerotiorum]
MAASDLPMATSSPHPEEVYMYPDIDEHESTHYQWQGGEPSAAADVPAFAIDPRLYQSLFPENPPQGFAEPSTAEFEEGSDDAQVYPPALLHEDLGEDDSEFVWSEGQSGSDEEEETDDEFIEEDDESDDSAARRRRRRGGGRFSGRYGARGGKGIKRGPRKPLDPGPEFKMYHSEATSAFIDGDYEHALEKVKQAIQVNPEMFPAHSLLSEIWLAKGDKPKALAALWNGAHTRPKDPTVWMKVARQLFDLAGDNRSSVLNDVVYCYSRVIDIQPKNYNARFQRAALYRELNHNGRAVTEYERILKDRPHSARALRHLAEIFIDLDDVQRAINHWTESVEYYKSLDPELAQDFSWSDANIYAELFGYVNQPHAGIEALKSLSRWLLGRRNDIMWEEFEDDDREWDSEDSPRRIKTDGFIPGQWPAESYGLGLPLELRVKMGLFRLNMGEKHHNEAMHHFEWLNPEDTSENGRIFHYGDLFREVADALKDVGLLEEALRFYSPIQQTAEYADISFFMAMADCCSQLGRLEDAEGCYLTVAEHEPGHLESRVQLAKLYESLGMSDQAFKYVNEAVLIGRQDTRTRRRRKDNRLEQLAIEFQGADTQPLRPIAPKPAGALTLGSVATLDKGRGFAGESSRLEDIQFLYRKMRELELKVKEGDNGAVEDWLDIADALLRDFRSNRVFYPMARTMEFQGYSSDAQRKAGKTKNSAFLNEMQEMAGRLQQSMSGESHDEPLQGAVPSDYHGISFDEWLDIFLQYSLLVTEQGEPEEAYETLDAAAVASVWYHDKRKSRMIHVCWFTCALRAQDEETLTMEARWFVKEYQFVTDTYRLFSMLSHLSGDPHKSLFHSSPSMKFMLRQIKAMDFTLPDSADKPPPSRQSIWKERASLSTRDEAGEPIPAHELDIALLVLYGNILYSGNSFYPALNYFFRAYALDDKNPAVLLSIALSYIHQSQKRQSENRHYLIMQGLSFMYEYRRARAKRGATLQEHQEVEFNFARVWHGLNLSHLAIEGYEKVLKIGDQIKQEASLQVSETANGAPKNADVTMTDADDDSKTLISKPQPFLEDFSREAAYALQCLHVLGGDTKMAKEVTGNWLVI